MSEQRDDEPAADLITRRGRFDVRIDRHLVAHVSGEVDVCTAPQLALELERLAADGGIVSVDLSNLEFCGAAGINVLFGAVRTLGTQGRLVIYDPPPTVARTIRITGLDHVVDVVVGRVSSPPHSASANDAEHGAPHRSVTAGAFASIRSATRAASSDLAPVSFDAEDR